ncbi:GntR family transcriptional regulator [Marasmitruncus massiliensis]|uniref:GntR family transcriptional regulator n=1 Tax=Marasmitruncus massiliensis TaxID=1944642 RepID=UPI000C797D37|nr:GntR family transcriptional regulator [Marasmitruncus massiliensis]MBE6906930.1 GntR family transcriptional regulator [Oscillospiraceae bacterium]
MKDAYKVEGIEELIVNTGLVDVVTNKIRDKIHTGALAPGQKLIVREIAEELKISQTPIKEALNRLIAEGYVEAIPRKSMIVKRISYHEYQDNMEIRMMCELFAIPTIISYSQQHPELVTIMEENIKQMRAVLDAPELDYDKWLKLDFYFHRHYMETVDNQAFISFYTSLRANRYSYFAFLDENKHPLSRKHLQLDNDEHHLILEAVREQNLSKLTAAVHEHIMRPRMDLDVGAQARQRIENVVKLYQQESNGI